jgi:simple sugar transport system permease protein
VTAPQTSASRLRLPGGVRLQRRVDVPRWLSVGVPIGSFIGALVVGAIVIALSGNDPFDTYRRIVERGFTSDGALSATLTAATPLLFTGLAAAAAFRMDVFNIGGEGQFIMGAVAASFVGLQLGDDLGAGVIPLMVLAGIVGGGLWAAIPGVLRAFASTNEIITSLMLNYVAGLFASYLIFNSHSYWRATEGSAKVFPQGKALALDAWWQPIEIGSLSVPLGYMVGVAAAVFAWLLYRTTRFGYEVQVIADSPRAARYAGMRTRRKVLSVLVLSGALAGIGGASDIGDIRHVLDPKGLSQAGYGYAGIVVAALARLNPLAVVPVSILLGGLSNAGRALQGPDFPSGLVGTLQGLILFFTLGGEILARYRVRRVRPHAAGVTP